MTCEPKVIYTSIRKAVWPESATTPPFTHCSSEERNKIVSLQAKCYIALPQF